MTSRTARDSERVSLERIHALPFVKSVQLKEARKDPRTDDGMLTIETNSHEFAFRLEIKKSFLSRADIDSLIAIQKLSADKLLLFARYVPLPAAEKLIAAGINFLDQHGNIHLDLLPHHLISQTGRTPDSQLERQPGLTRAAVQFLFSVAHSPESLNSPVRELAQPAGVSTGSVSSAKKALLAKGLFVSREGREVLVANPKELRDTLVRGYLDLLRPRLVMGRYEAPYRTARELFEKTGQSGSGGRLALTGSAAAYELQKIYRTSDICLFVERFDADVQKKWRLIPSKNGPVVLLRAFGETVYWKKVGRILLSTPWLIYSEMYASPDPRSHEAAEELRAKYIE